MQRYGHLGYLCMCQPYRGAQNHLWRYEWGAYGLHAPHLGEAQKLPFLDIGNFQKKKVPKKEIFGPPPNGGHGARMRPDHISRGLWGYPPSVHRCRDMATEAISACVSPTGVPKMSPRDVIGVHTGSMSPIPEDGKNFLFWIFGNFQKRQCQKRQFLSLPKKGNMEPVCASLVPPGLIWGTHPGLTHAEKQQLDQPKNLLW